MHFDLAWSRLALGFVLRRQEERERARGSVQLAGRMFEDMGVGPGQERVGAALAALDQGASPVRA